LLLALAACASGPPPAGDVPASVAQPEFQIGNKWTYLVRDGYNGQGLRTYSEEVVAIAADRISMGSLGVPSDTGSPETYSSDGNPMDVRTPRVATPMRYTPYYPAYVFPLEVGKKWQQEMVIT